MLIQFNFDARIKSSIFFTVQCAILRIEIRFQAEIHLRRKIALKLVNMNREQSTHLLLVIEKSQCQKPIYIRTNSDHISINHLLLHRNDVDCCQTPLISFGFFFVFFFCFLRRFYFLISFFSVYVFPCAFRKPICIAIAKCL